MDQPKGDRRRHPRWAVGGRLAGQFAATHKSVSVVDISRGGALIEHPSILPSRIVSSVILLFPGQEVRLRCRVVRSEAYRYEVWPSGARDWIYRTGLEFLDTSGPSLRLIEGYIQFLHPR